MRVDMDKKVGVDVEMTAWGYKIKYFNYSYEDYQLTREEILTWPLMGNIWQLLLVISLYLLFVLKIGPKHMKNREAYNLRPIMLIYNFYQTIFNGWFVSMLLVVEGALSMAVTRACNPPQVWETPYYRLGANMGWYFFISKVLDFFDTIFLVLRKKESHVSFLHVYHHTNMAIFTWVYLRHIQDPQGMLVGWLNACVHTVMYSYYFLAALGPKVRKHLWWKKYITRFQMIQFIIIITYMVGFLLVGCKVSANFAYMLIFQGASFFILFTNFYIRAYVKRADGAKYMTLKNNNKQNIVTNGKVLEKQN